MREIFQLLLIHDFIEGDELCQVAMGKYELPTDNKSKWNKFKRNVKVYIRNKQMEKEYKNYIK